MYRNNGLMLGLTASSLFCLIVLVGGYLYSGSVLPSTQQTYRADLLVKWLLWTVVVGTPAFTGVLWLLRLRINADR